MSPLLAPLLAQLVSLELGNRTEARYVGYYGDTRAEASTTPRVGVGVTHRRTFFGTSYTPSLTLSPLERDSRRLFVFHQVNGAVAHRLRYTTLGLGGSYAIGTRLLNLAGVQGLLAPTLPTPTDTAGTPAAPASPGAPATPPATPVTPGTPTMPGATPSTGVVPSATQGTDRTIRYYTWTASANVSHRVSKEVQVNATAGTTTSEGMNDISRLIVGSYRAYFVGGGTGYTYTPSKQDSLVSNLNLFKIWSSNDNEAAIGTATETWSHRFDGRTTSLLGLGMNVTRFSQSNGLAGISVFPNFQAGISHRVPLDRATLTLSTSLYSAPFLDPLRATVDPRIGAGGAAIYARQKLTLTATANTTLSVAPNDTRYSAVNSSVAEGRAAYRLGELTSVDTGARVARQTYGGDTVVPLSWAVFAALTVGATWPLIR